jgi:4-amino-4-deoxy-L-arabinose transferase-like glycosyltransferase
MSMNVFINRSWGIKVGVVIVFLCLCYFPIFLHLDSRTLREWDEARNAINAFEMSRSNSFIVKTYQGSPDLWETKPPLLVWMQVVCFKTLGYTELAVRLPSALATLGLSLFLFYFFYRNFNKPFIGILAAMVLLTSNGYIHDHAARTGDHDALLVCFEIIMLLSFFMYSETNNKKQLWLSALFMVLAIYTKSIAPLLFIPGIMIYLLIFKKFMHLLKDKTFWLALISGLILVSAYYICRELAAPGYLKAVWENELFPRYFNTAEIYKYEISDFWFYKKELKEWQFQDWYHLLIPAVIINLLTCRDILKRLHLLLLINAVVFFIIISKGTTNVWYDLPLIALFALIIGLAFYQLGYIFYSKLNLGAKFGPIIKSAILLASAWYMFYDPYKFIVHKLVERDEINTEVQYGYVFRAMEKEYPGIRSFMIYNPSGSNYPLVFYRDVFHLTKGYDIQNIYPDQLKPAAGYIVILKDKLHEIEDSGIAYEVVFNHNNAYLIHLKP